MGFGKSKGFTGSGKTAQRSKRWYSNLTVGKKQELFTIINQRRRFKRDKDQPKKMKDALKKYWDELSKATRPYRIDRIPYFVRVSRIENYIRQRKVRGEFTLEEFVMERNDIDLEYCYVCHKTLFSKQSNILQKKNIKADVPKEIMEKMPEKMVVCHRCHTVMSKEKSVPAQSFWNKLYPGDIPDCLGNLTPMEIRLIQRMIPFMKIVKYQGRFGQYGLQGQAVLFAQDLDEVLDILPRKPNSMGLFMVVESLKNIERQREMVVNKDKIEKALSYLCEYNERYKDVMIDRKTLEELEIDYSQICVVAPAKENNVKDHWKKIDIPGVSVTSNVFTLQCKRHDLSETFAEHAGKQSLSMCVSSLIQARIKDIYKWDVVDLDTILEEGHFLHVESTKDISCNLVTFNTIKRCFSLFSLSLEIAFVEKLIFKRDKFCEYIQKFLDHHGVGVIYTNKVYISVIKNADEYYFFDCRPRGPKGYKCTKNKNNEYSGGAIVMKFTNFNLFIKRLMSQLKSNNSSEYTLATVIISEANKEGFVSTFGDVTPSLHSNPLLKEASKDQDTAISMDCNTNILSDLTERLTLNTNWPLFASHSQADVRYSTYSNKQCTAMSCAAIVKSLLTPLSNWTTDIMDQVLEAGNDLYIETCNKLQSIRYIAASEIINTTNKFNSSISLNIQWLQNLPVYAVELKEAIDIHFEQNGHTNGILTCQSFSYAIMFQDNHYWFFDSHSNPPNGKAVLHRTNLEGLMSILNSKISNPAVTIFDISHVNATFLNDIDWSTECRLDYCSNGKHKLPEQPHTDAVLKKMKLERNTSEYELHRTPKKDDFDLMMDENEGMCRYLQLYDTRRARDEELYNRFYVTPWKDDLIESPKKEQFIRRLDLFDEIIEKPEVLEEVPTSKQSDIPLLHVTTASLSEKYQNLAKLSDFDIVACIVSILNLSVDSFTGWSINRLHSVLNEADSIFPSFDYINDVLVCFGETFNYDKFFYGKASTQEIKELLNSFFKIHDYGLLQYNNNTYAVSYMNEYYCFFDPHSCNSNGYPTKDGTSCIIVTNDFGSLIETIFDRLAHDDNSLRITLENKKKFILLALQVETINDTNIVQRERHYDNLSSVTVIESSVHSTFLQENEHLCTSVVAAATNFINSFDIWDEDFIDRLLTDGSNLFCHLKSSEVYIENSFKMFTLSGLNLQTSVTAKIDFNESCLRDSLKKYFKSYDSGIISVNGKFFTIMCKDENYCIFDSHGINHQVSQRKASAIIVKSLPQLEDLILLKASQNHITDNVKVSIYRLEITKINKVDFTNTSGSLSYSNITENGEHIFLNTPIDCPISLMRPIDNIIPKTDELFNVNMKEKDINSDDIPLISITRATKPPLNHKINRRFEEYCFPVQFPEGINGLNEDREIKITPLQYFQSRIMNKDPRFNSKEYLLFALNYVENEKVSSNISVCGKIKKNHQSIQNVASNLHLVMRTIRGTSAYWGNALLDLLAMVKVLGPGTAFLTLSCNDLNWDFMLKACLQAEGKGNIDTSSLTLEERQHLVENNPVMVSRLFNREIQNMIKLLKNGQALNPWKVTDYWYRIEWQQRGSPHCHMIIWIKDFPKLNTPEGIKAMESLCRCDIPDDDKELATLVQRYQRHHCTQTCYKNRSKPSKDDSNNDNLKQDKVKSCRFSFPRKICNETKVLDPETTEFIKNGHRLVQMKRNSNAIYINNYNANILRIWHANMDFQFITSQAIIAYVAKYSCKSEPTSLHHMINAAIKEAQEQNEETKRTLFKVTMKILNERQVSCCEAATRLCHLPMKGCSRAVVFINTSRPEERYRMINLASSNPENNSYYSNIIDRYILRPDSMEEMSLAEFAMEYQPHYHKKNEETSEENGDFEFFENDEQEVKRAIKLKDGKSFIKKRLRSAVFRSRYFSLTENRSDYFYGLLLLHLPFRSESELLQKIRINDNIPIEHYPNDKSDIAFFEKRHLLRPFSSTCSVEEYLEYSIELQNAIRQMEALMNGLNADPEQNDTDEQNRTLADDFRDGDANQLDPNLPSADLLNNDQRKLFKLVLEYIRLDHQNEHPNQILTFTTGSAGTGKSFLIAQIIKIVKDYYEPKYPNSRVIYVTAPTGIAARLINGQTLHNALSLGIELGEVSKYKSLTGNYLKQKRELWKNVKFLIIDEISMVSYEMFKNIDLRLKELMYNEKPFGGINVLVFGDLMQLPPVLGHSIYERPNYTAELHLWRLFDFCELKQNMRQKNDQSFVDLLNALRVGELKHEHRKLIVQRVENESLKREGIFDDMTATLIAPINRTVQEHNNAVLLKLIANNREQEKDKYRRDPKYEGYYLIKAIDELQVKSKDPNWEKFIPKDDNKCAGVPKELKLAIGARVMLRRNIDVSTGLVNGSLGVIKCFNWGGCFLKDQSERGDLPESVTVTFDGIGDRDIRPQRCEFNATGGHGKVDRLQLPLILAWAVTAHKLQGVTVETAVIDLGSTIFEKGQAYVMLSRAKNLEKVLILRNFDVTKLEKKYVNNKAITEMARLRKLQQVDWNSFLKSRELSDSRLKLN